MTSPILVTGGTGTLGALYPQPGAEAALGRRSWLAFLAEKPSGQPA
jgi:hypothetical protein